ncbi:helix-turn-helix domain-containing protein [Streptomyces sp. NPDC088755]|uniref:helix-turn-helix domain-containing protein n=1 Tax=Streptomyces sp. NPDC088755 TaxID=3365888 RepID=UPI00380A5CE7
MDAQREAVAVEDVEHVEDVPGAADEAAVHGIFTTTELVPMLRVRGIELSASQIHRLVSGTPERLSLQVLAAFCDILACSPADLVATPAENAGVRKTATGGVPAPPSTVAKLRPRPTRILPDA